MSATNVIPLELIQARILLLRGQKVLLDRDLALLYGVETRVLNQAVKRNAERFPNDFMFALTRGEILGISQSVTSSEQVELKFSKSVLAFTEQGVAMLSGVLHSPRAIQVNIAVMRTFVQLRRWMSLHEDLARKLEKLERNYDVQFKSVFDAIRELMERTEPPAQPPREIGFHTLLADGKQPKAKTRSKKHLP